MGRLVLNTSARKTIRETTTLNRLLILAKIETFLLSIPSNRIPELQHQRGGTNPVADSLLVQVTTDQGLEGWGKAFGFRAVRLAKLAIEELIAPLCIGEDATQICSSNVQSPEEIIQPVLVFSSAGLNS